MLKIILLLNLVNVNDNIVGTPYPLIKGEQDLPKIESFGGGGATQNFARKGG